MTDTYKDKVDVLRRKQDRKKTWSVKKVNVHERVIVPLHAIVSYSNLAHTNNELAQNIRTTPSLSLLSFPTNSPAPQHSPMDGQTDDLSKSTNYGILNGQRKEEGKFHPQLEEQVRVPTSPISNLCCLCFLSWPA